jgi:hypothetical protein
MKKRIVFVVLIIFFVTTTLISYELEIWKYQAFHAGSLPAMVFRFITYLSAIFVLFFASLAINYSSMHRIVGCLGLIAATVIFVSATVTVEVSPSEGVLKVKLAGNTVQVVTLHDQDNVTYCFASSAVSIEIRSDGRPTPPPLFVGPLLVIASDKFLEIALIPFGRCAS